MGQLMPRGKNRMDDSQELSGDKEVVEDPNSSGMPSESDASHSPSDGIESADTHPDDHAKRPSGWQRLKRKNQEHEREIHALHARIAELQQNAPPQANFASPNYGYSGNGSNPAPGMDETIQKAVGYALQQKDMEERKAREAQAQSELGKEYSELQKHLDKASDKYDDFDDVVRGDAPFTPTIRDTALLLPKDGAGSAAEVLYKLGKDRDSLEKIIRLYPHQQAAAVIALSHALTKGGGEKSNESSSARPLGTVKANPVVNSVGVTDKTTPAQIRALMKAGKFK